MKLPCCWLLNANAMKSVQRTCSSSQFLLTRFRGRAHGSLLITRILRQFCLLLFSFLSWNALNDSTWLNAQEWQKVQSPEVWKKPPASKQGYLWYRCAIQIPATWRNSNFELFIEPVDDAREFYINGTKVGSVGSFPPEFRSGLGGQDRHSIPPGIILPGKINTLAIRVYDSDGRGGFNVASPVLFSGENAIRLEGVWQYRAGDNPDWSSSPFQTIADELPFSQIVSASEANRILRRLPGESGPLIPTDALKRFRTAPGLEVELALSEPHIGQPLSMKFDERGRLWVVQYLQYPAPAGLKMVSRDKFLRSVYDKTPLPPPNHFPGADKITIHEDTNSDGFFDQHKTFVGGLSLATSIEFDRDGVWILNPPYLLFYPDKDHDDVPDGNPEVHLEGFGLEDSHSVTNNLRWGPDGWLYASQGSTVTGNIKRFGSKEKPIHSMGQLIWRYHPRLRRYEIFAEGGGNSFGVEFDSKGRVYSGHNGGDTRGFHYVQGGYYQKGFGKHGSLSNPYAFGYFEMMKHHSVQRFTHCFVFYEGGALGSAYEGKLFGVAPMLNHVVYSSIKPRGSTFETEDIGLALSTDDPWFRPVDIQAGPDGALYIADMYEQRIDHASHYQGRIDRESGRIYRLKKQGNIASQQLLAAPQTNELLRNLASANKWQRQTSQRLLAQSQESPPLESDATLWMSAKDQEALELLWAKHRRQPLSENEASLALKHDSPFVRLWAIRLICDQINVSQSFAELMAETAQTEPNVEVRSQLACSARRLPAGLALPILESLLGHDKDADDPHIPLLIWWALESKVETNRDLVIALFESPDFWRLPIVRKHMIERIMRRFASAGSQQDLNSCARLLQLAPTNDDVQSLMVGFEKAYEGRSLTGIPSSLLSAMTSRGAASLALRLRQSEKKAITEAMERIVDDKVKKGERIQLIQILGQVHPAAAKDLLVQMATSSRNQDIQVASISALQSYEDERVATALIQSISSMSPDAKSVSISVLSSRPVWAKALLKSVETNQIVPTEFSSDVVQRMLIYADDAMLQQIKLYWPKSGNANPEELRNRIATIAAKLESGTGNPYSGKVIYRTQCGKCHVLFEEGGPIGPELTQYKRDDVMSMLANIVNPNLQIREGFESYHVLTQDGLVLNGFISDQDSKTVVLRTSDGQTNVISKDEIESMKASPVSIMPSGLLDSLNDQQLRDLFAYLRATQPLN